LVDGRDREDALDVEGCTGLYLPNGTYVEVHERRNVELVRSYVALRGGVAYEPLGLCGLTHALEHMLFRGSDTYSRNALADVLDQKAIEVEALTHRDDLILDFLCTREQALPALVLQAEMLCRPILEPAAFEIERAILIDEVVSTSDADEMVKRHLWLGHIGRPSGGTQQSLETIQVGNLQAWHHRQLKGGNLGIFIHGDVDARTVARHVQSLFGGIPAGETHVGPSLTSRDRHLLLRPEELEHATVMMSWPVPVPGSNSHVAFEALQRLLAGGLGSVIRRDLIEDRGWLYEMTSEVDAYASAATFDLIFVCTSDRIRDVVSRVRELIASWEPTEAHLAQHVAWRGLERALSRDYVSNLLEDRATRWHRGFCAPQDPLTLTDLQCALDYLRVATPMVGVVGSMTEAQIAAVAQAIPVNSTKVMGEA
jgi:predicted Zn-dependent peptidase